MSVSYLPDPLDASFDSFRGVPFEDPGSSPFAAASPTRVDARYFLKPVQDELLNLVALALSSGQVVPVRNESGSELARGSLVYAVGVRQVTALGDSATQLSSWIVRGVNAWNSAAGRLYWELLDDSGERTVNLYRDAALSLRVATGTRSGDGTITLAAVDGSGISGSVDVAYSADDGDPDNILELNRVLVDAALADDAATLAAWVLDGDLADDANGYAFPARDVGGLDTSSAAAVGAGVYLSASSAGDFVFTPPAGAGELTQPVGVVLAKDASAGAVRFFPWPARAMPFGAPQAVPFFDANGHLSHEATHFNFDSGQHALLVGGSTLLGLASRLQLQADAGPCIARHFAWSNVSVQGNLHYAARARGTRDSPAATQDADTLASWIGMGFDGTDFTESASFNVLADGAHSTGQTPGQAAVRTTPSGSSVSAQRTLWRADGTLIHMGEAHMAVANQDGTQAQHVGGKIKVGATPAAFKAADDDDGKTLSLRAQDGGDHTSNDPDGGDIELLPGAAGSGGSGSPGHVKFGAHQSVGGESLSGYIEIKDASGTVRKLAVIS